MADKHFQVVIRCQPSAEEKAWRVGGDNRLELPAESAGEDGGSFSFDRVLTEQYTHAEFYDSVIAPSIQRLLKGESGHVAVLTYGLPCTGKSHTVFGTSGQTRVRPEARGVAMRCGEQLFRELSSNTTSRVVASFYHVFESEEGKRSRVADLFDMKKRDLEIVEEPTTHLYSIPALTEQSITSTQELLGLVEKGYLMRNATGCVKDSARKPAVKFGSVSTPPLQQYRQHCSNAVFTLKCEQLPEGEDEVVVSHITVVDLAGVGIEQIHSENSCSDSGIKTLHQILKQGDTAAALCAQSSLTKLLKPCFGGNCDTIVVGNVSLKCSAVDLTRKCLQTLSAMRNVKNLVRVVKIPVGESELGKCLEEGEKARRDITEKLGMVTTVKAVEVVGEREVKLDDAMHEDMSSSLLNLAKQVISAESQLIRGREPMQKSVNSGVHSAMQRPQPLAMVRPLYPQQTDALSSSVAAKIKQAVPSAIKSKAPSPLVKATLAWKEPDTDNVVVKEDTPAAKLDVDAVSSVSSSSIESSDSEGKVEVPATPDPAVSGPPPPPLRGIPHLNPDDVNINDANDDPPLQIKPHPPVSSLAPSHVTTVIPSHVRSTPPTFLSAAAGGLTAGSHLNPQRPLHSLFNSPPSSAVKFVPPSSSVLHGETQSTAVPLAPIPSQLQTSVYVHSDRSIEEVASSGGSSSTVSPESQHYLLREPVLVSPGPRTVTPLPLPPVTSTPASLLSTEVTTNINAQTHKKPPVPPAQRESSQKLGQRKDDSSSESSESFTTDSEHESLDLQDEARDAFDTRLPPRNLQRLKPIQRNLASLTPMADTGQLQVLPPIILSGEMRSDILPPIQASPLQVLQENPPTYRETASSYPTAMGPPVYNTVDERGRGAAASRAEPFLPSDFTQYMSNEEIHVAAMEGVSNSQMKSLAIQFGVDFRDHGGRTPLMYTIIGNQPKMCATLIKLRAAVNAQDSSGMSPLLWATYLAKPDIIKILLRNGASIDHCDPGGRSAFHWAMKTPNIQCLKWLCKYISSPLIVNQADNEGLTPLHWAVMSDQPSHVKLFLTSSNADIGVQDRDGRTALNFAVLNFSPSCIRAILDCCENAVNLIDNKGRTALHYACAEGSADCVRTLLSYHSCDLHCADNKGTTPLHWAAAANQPGLVQLLLRRGADRTIRDYEDKLPRDYAEERGHTECVKLLQSYGHRRPSSAVSHAGFPPPTTTPTLDERGHVMLKNPTRRFSLSGESMTSFDHRLPADGQAQDGGSEVEHGRLLTQTSVELDREGGGGGETQWADSQRSLEVMQSPTSRPGRTSLPPQQGRTERRRWIRALLCGCTSQRSSAVAPSS